jgi:uncharacterized protein
MTFPADLALFFLGAFVGAFASGLAGFAFALVASSLWLHVLPPVQATPLIVASALLLQCFTLWRLRQGVQLGRLWPFVVGGIPAVPLGVLLLQHASPSVFRVGIGFFLVAYSLFMLLRPPLCAFAGGGRLADGAVGALGGVLGGLCGLNGALPTVWCDLRGWPKDEQRGVYQPYIVATHIVALTALGTAGTFSPPVLERLALAVPALILGAVLGLRLYQTLDAIRFRRILLWMLLVSGALLLV